jgi:hypothetical protein
VLTSRWVASNHRSEPRRTSILLFALRRKLENLRHLLRHGRWFWCLWYLTRNWIIDGFQEKPLTVSSPRSWHVPLLISFREHGSVQLPVIGQEGLRCTMIPKLPISSTRKGKLRTCYKPAPLLRKQNPMDLQNRSNIIYYYDAPCDGTLACHVTSFREN